MCEFMGDVRDSNHNSLGSRETATGTDAALAWEKRGLGNEIFEQYWGKHHKMKTTSPGVLR